jgi:hypothetical protein
VILIAGFIAVERRTGDHALVPPDVMGNHDFAYTCAAILLMSAVFFASMLYLPQLMIKVMDYSAIGAGAGMLPMLGTFAAVSFAAGSLYERFGPKILLICGSLCIAVAPALIALLVGDGSGEIPSYGSIAPGMAILGLGIGLFYPTATTVGSPRSPSRAEPRRGDRLHVPDRRGSVGLGLTTTVFTEAGEGASSAAAAGFIDGIETAFTMDAAIAVGGFLIATFLIGGRPHLRRAAHRKAAGPSPRGHGLVLVRPRAPAVVVSAAVVGTVIEAVVVGRGALT